MKYEDTPKELFAKTGRQKADDYEAFVESSKEPAPKGLRDPAFIPDWRTAKSLLKLKTQIDAAFPGRSKSKDGSIGDATHCPNQNHTGSSDHCLNIVDGTKRVVAALDVTHDPEKCDVDNIVEAIRADKDARVKYIIWNKRICNSSPIGGSAAWAWRNYTGDDPHTGHVHFSVKSSKPVYDDESDWSISS